MVIKVKRSGSSTLFEIGGKLDLTAASILQESFEQLLPGDNTVVFDMKGVDFINSAGIGAIIWCNNEAKKKDINIRLLHVHPSVYKVLELIQADKFLDIELDPSY